MRRIIIAALLAFLPIVAHAQGINNPCQFGTTSGTCIQGAGPLGTPSSGVATNLTGTASGLTAGNVTTNAPLNSAIVNSTYNLTTASGTQTVSGFGFTPSSCDSMGTTGASATSYTTVNGHSDAALNQSSLFYSTATFGLNNASFLFAADVTGTNYQFAAITAYNSGSITLTWTKAGSPTGTFSFSIRCYK